MGPSILPTLAPTVAFAHEDPENLLISGKTAEPAGDAQRGFFAVLMSHLTAEAPAAVPVAPEPVRAFAIPSPQTDQTLPPAGNVLPLPVAQTTEREVGPEVETDPAPIIIATSLKHGEVPASPGLPRPVAARPDSTGPAAPGRPTVTQADDSRVIAASATPVGNTADPEQPVRRVALSSSRAYAEELPTGPTQPVNPRPAPVAAMPDSMAPLTATAPAPAQPAPVSAPQPTYNLNHPLADTRWGESLGQRVMWMSDQGVGRAEIRLNPPELGPLDIRISVADDEARVAFTVQHSLTREAVEAAVPRLREMFAEQGINLTDASVSQQSSGDRRQAGDTADHSGTQASRTGPGDDGDSDKEIRWRGESLIDTYA